jgi:PPOX class probable F420-dependent enzyme
MILAVVELEEMRSRVRDARVGRIATVTPDGAPHVVPFVFVLDGDTLYSSVDEKPKASRDLRRIENIRADPRVEVVVDHYEEPWDPIWWVRIRGRAEVLESGPERDRALQLLRDKYEEYREMPPQGPVVAVRTGRWRGWSFRPVQ